MSKKRKIRNFALVLILVFIVFTGYVMIVNLNSKNMTVRQKILKAIYPALLGFGKLTGKNQSVLVNKNNTKPPQDFYSLATTMNNGINFSFASLKGKKVMLVNTASDCGYTGQYEALEELYKKFGEKLMILAFPANDFKEQEKGTDKDIAEFCKMNYGVTFPIASKSTVIKGNEQNEIFKWLSDKSRNGWNEQAPKWNFSKYLVNEQGLLTHYFDPAVSPMSEEVADAIK